ncbi:host attachment protein [Azohydromonas caseinilytica]|uniref:Host attachment protein n=1 Tax=Azohydromonas caseinilytica TaxID=2728836 RepID=A0A848F6M4_9BURK|nr:host attachment protein [Azohydromonas caseinilytica]NML15747.1 host attachment protein [Azohydromonas caseinilytica]
MSADLILIASAQEARLLTRADSEAELVVLETLRWTGSHLGAGMARPMALPPGRGVSSVPLDPRRRQWREFAGVVARRFEELLAQRHFDRALLFAACPFLSELMRQLSRATKQQLLAVVDADIIDLKLPQTLQRIEQELQAAEAALA